MGYKVTDIFGYGNRNTINLREIEDNVLSKLSGEVEKGDYEINFEIPINVPNYMKEASYLLTRENKKVAYVMKNKNITAIVGYIKNV